MKILDSPKFFAFVLGLFVLSIYLNYNAFLPKARVGLTDFAYSLTRFYNGD